MSESNNPCMKSRILFLLLLCGLGASAQPYTLEECRRMALENNRKLIRGRLDVGMAEQSRHEAFTRYFPTVSAAGTIFGADHGMMQMDLALPLPGMNGPISMSMLKHGKMAGLTALQPVFAGGQIVNGNKLARLGEDVSRFRLELTEKEVLETTERYFWQIVSLREKLRTIGVIEQQLERVRHDVELAVRAGLKTRNDLLRVELRQQEIGSSRLTVENGIGTGRMLLAQYIGVPNADVSCEEFGEPETPVSLYMSPEEAVLRRTEYLLLEKNVEAEKLRKRMELGKNLPTVGVGAGYMYHDLTGKDTDFGMVFAGVSVPISSWWGGAHAMKRQRLKMERAENERDEAVEMMQVEIQQCWNELQEAYKQILIARESIESATENLRLNNDYFNAGTVALTDLLDAQTLLQQSRNRYTDACTDYRVKKARYLRVTGR